MRTSILRHSARILKLSYRLTTNRLWLRPLPPMASPVPVGSPAGSPKAASTASPAQSSWEKFEQAFRSKDDRKDGKDGKNFRKRSFGNDQRNVGGRNHHGGGDRSGQNPSKKKFKKGKSKAPPEGSNEVVLGIDVRAMLERLRLEDGSSSGEVEADGEAGQKDTPAPPSLPEQGTEIDVKVTELSSTGDGLALQEGSQRIYVVPFAVPGDTLRVRVYKHLNDQPYSVADFVSVVTPSPQRDDARIKCQYFGRCAGCQLQPMSYADQLAHKRRVVEKAFANFSDLPPELVPAVDETMGSPLEFGYRTKLTPHFDAPPGARRRGPKPQHQECPSIGFQQKGVPKTLDIEDCPIGTDSVRKGMARERRRMTTDYAKFSNGATILLRESTKRYFKDESGTPIGFEESAVPADAVKVETSKYVDIKTCITDNNAMTTEYVDDYVFTNPAGSFFQNNNSILPKVTSYIRDHLLPKNPTTSPIAQEENGTTTTTTTPEKPAQKQIRHLIDAYSGSGLFTVTLSSLLASSGSSGTGGSSIGIDIADGSIASARHNASLNGLPQDVCRFVAADAKELFKSVVGVYDPDETAVVLDPPRRGCDASFLRQLLAFAPRRVVYVSCNVHTQARDVGMLVRGEVDGDEKQKPGGRGEGARYAIESLKGFDFFPQTSHVEGVTVLNRVDEAATE